jgi:class 3 adenylate cyclase
MGEVGERELLAIIFTDAVGSSSQTAQDEDKSLSMLMADLDFIRNEAGVRGGSVLKNTGDGLLISFKSAVDAVECALAIQKSFQSRPKGSGFQHKIGVHIGDVIKKDGDIYGAGVNTASRLTDQCQPGGICLSSTLFELTKQKSEIGRLNLKNFLLQNTDPPTLAYQTHNLDGMSKEQIEQKFAAIPPSHRQSHKTVWLSLGAAGMVIFATFIWQKAQSSKEDLKNSQLYGFEYKAGPAEGLKSAKNGSPIEWTLENNTDQSLELRWFDFDGRPKVSDNLNLELSRLGPGKLFQGKTYQGHAFGLFDAEKQAMLGSFRFISGDRLSLVAEKYGDRICVEPKFLRKAKAGDAIAQAQLAYAFWDGNEGIPQNNREAEHWAKLSLNQGNSFGMCVYAGLLDMGSGVPQNSAFALQLWQRAADAGEGWALGRLGDRYLNGYGGVTRDYPTAVHYLQRSVEKGYHWGMVNLGRCYELGLGVPVDLDRAEELYRKATENPNCKEGKDALAKLLKKREKTVNQQGVAVPAS